MAGTASTVRSWLLLEDPGPWGRDALLRRAAARTRGSRAPTTVRRRGRPPALDPPDVVEPLERGRDSPASRSAPDPSPRGSSARVCRTSPRRSTSTCPPSAGASGRGSSRSRDRSSSCARTGVATSAAPNAAARSRRRSPPPSRSRRGRAATSAATGSRATSSRSRTGCTSVASGPTRRPGWLARTRTGGSRSSTSGVGRATRCPSRRPSWPSAPRRGSSASTTSCSNAPRRAAASRPRPSPRPSGRFSVSIAVEETPASFLTCHSPVAEPAPAYRTIAIERRPDLDREAP